MSVAEAVTLIEVGPRDGFQREGTRIPTPLKVETVEGLASAGIRHIQVTSFVHPGRVPQMADAEEVCARLKKAPEVTYSALVLNRKGLKRAQAAGIRHLETSISVSETHSRRNANCSVKEALGRLREMAALARESGIALRAGLQSAFGCAYEGPVPLDRVLELLGEIAALEVDQISLADTA